MLSSHFPSLSPSSVFPILFLRKIQFILQAHMECWIFWIQRWLWHSFCPWSVLGPVGIDLQSRVGERWKWRGQRVAEYFAERQPLGSGKGVRGTFLVPRLQNQPANTGDTSDAGLIPGSERFSGTGNGNPLQYSCLWNPMDRGACQISPWGCKS